MGTQTVTSFIWTENEYHKGANEISSCLFYYLNSIVDLSPYKTIRLICDGCGGQNKNTILISMVAYWLSKAPGNIKEVQLVFPVTGHSFIPPDRVFGNIEKEIKKQENIVSPTNTLI
ncbi:unnamed protein product [Diabrotica balteata]|uniref:DUF7869 domain-containing protein n=1 Tax=Diabrotica balteata TaxID=107213 RepID=A0A9N9TAG2_DIABA|nr:unnamed protein product [Diabrotica balteata]